MDEVVATQQSSSGLLNPLTDVTPVQKSQFKLRRRGGKLSSLVPFWRQRSLGSGYPFQILRPLIMSVAIVLAGSAVVWMAPGLLDSIEQRSLHRAAVHPDNTAANTHVVAAFTTPKILVYRDLNGTLHRILADETEVNRFVNETLIYLETKRNEIKAETQSQILMRSSRIPSPTAKIALLAMRTGISNGDGPGRSSRRRRWGA